MTSMSNPAPVKLPARSKRPLVDIALLGTALGSNLVLGLGMPNLVDGTGLVAIGKVVTLTVSAAFVTFAVNRLAIDRGAPLAVKGYVGAAVISLASIAMVGGGLFSATYSGLTYKDVAELQLQQHAAAIRAHVTVRSDAAAEATRIAPGIRAIVGDLKAKADCEIASACLSGRGGGYGTVARIAEEQAGHAASIGRQVEAGEVARQTLLEELNTLLASLDETLADDERDLRERRTRAQGIDSRIRQALGELKESVPLPLIRAYAGELRSGVSIPERPEAEARLSALLSRHGATLTALAASTEERDELVPAFPRKTGVTDTFSYIGHFLPVAAIAAVVDLVLPLVLWAYTFWALSWEVHQTLSQRGEIETPRRPARTPVTGAGSGAGNGMGNGHWKDRRPGRRNADARRDPRDDGDDHGFGQP
ncbi:hypothetical protein [Stappia indica]|uniref:hypothetical protein n=1 Tax=Stappia indica TaxID=538381 RepID=UPI0008377F2D|nr:hypothetical protein [Stappia indica]